MNHSLLCMKLFRVYVFVFSECMSKLLLMFVSFDSNAPMMIDIYIALDMYTRMYKL